MQRISRPIHCIELLRPSTLVITEMVDLGREGENWVINDLRQGFSDGDDEKNKVPMQTSFHGYLSLYLTYTTSLSLSLSLSLYSLYCLLFSLSYRLRFHSFIRFDIFLKRNLWIKLFFEFIFVLFIFLMIFSCRRILIINRALH